MPCVTLAFSCLLLSPMDDAVPRPWQVLSHAFRLSSFQDVRNLFSINYLLCDILYDNTRWTRSSALRKEMGHSCAGECALEPDCCGSAQWFPNSTELFSSKKPPPCSQSNDALKQRASTLHIMVTVTIHGHPDVSLEESYSPYSIHEVMKGYNHIQYFS